MGTTMYEHLTELASDYYAGEIGLSDFDSGILEIHTVEKRYRKWLQEFSELEKDPESRRVWDDDQRAIQEHKEFCRDYQHTKMGKDYTYDPDQAWDEGFQELFWSEHNYYWLMNHFKDSE